MHVLKFGEILILAYDIVTSRGGDRRGQGGHVADSKQICSIHFRKYLTTIFVVFLLTNRVVT